MKRAWMVVVLAAVVVFGMAGPASARWDTKDTRNVLHTGTQEFQGGVRYTDSVRVSAELSVMDSLHINGAIRIGGTTLLPSAAELNQSDGGLVMKVGRDTASVASLNAGKIILPAVTGRAITVHWVRVRAVTDSIEGLTALVISDTHTSPVAVLTVAAAELIPAGISSTEVYDSGVTWGRIGLPLTADKGLKATITGSTATTDTGHAEITYGYSQ